MSIFQSPFFPQVDTKLRAGYHISEDDIELTSFVSEHLDELREFYSNYAVDLVRTSEHVFYLRAKDNSMMGRVTLSALDMLVGRLLCYMKMHLHDYDRGMTGWFPFESLIAEFRALVPSDVVAAIYKSRENLTDQELNKLVDKIKTTLRRLKKLNFVSLKEGAELYVKVNNGIFRFSADVRSGDEGEGLLRLIREEGEMDLLDADVEDYQVDDKQDLGPSEDQLDFLAENNQ